MVLQAIFDETEQKLIISQPHAGSLPQLCMFLTKVKWLRETEVCSAPRLLTIFACDRFVAKGQMSSFWLDWPFCISGGGGGDPVLACARRRRQCRKIPVSRTLHDKKRTKHLFTWRENKMNLGPQRPICLFRFKIFGQINVAQPPLKI